MKITYPYFWKNATQIRKRFYSIAIVFAVALIAMAIGGLIPLSEQDAITISQNLNSTLQEHKASNTLTQYIFLNNFLISLLMFVPVIGAALGLIILFDTGLALSAIASTQGFPVWVGLGSLIVTPVFWLEFAAYSVAMAESIWLFTWLYRSIVQWRFAGLIRELKWAGIFIGACAGLLILGALVEVLIINLAAS